MSDKFFYFMVEAFLLVLALTPMALKLAFRFDFLDRPGGRKRHKDAVPPVGGLVIFPVFMLLAAHIIEDWTRYGWFYAALTLILVTGGLDDRFNIAPRIKFAAQFVAAFVIVVPGGAQVVSLGNLLGFGTVWLGFMSIPFSIIATVLLINAINLMDGLDGLAGGMGAIILGLMAFCAAPSAEATELIVACGALAGFLVFNMRSPWRSQARIFLGDAGSMAIGLVLSWYVIRLAGGATPMIQPATAAWLLALPIMDTCGQFARRVREGRHPFSADQFHFHYLVVQAGLTPGKASAFILGIIFLYGMIGMTGIALGVSPWILMYVWAGLLLIHIYLAMRPDRFRRLIARVVRARKA